MSKHLLPGILAMAGTVVASNILVQYLLGPWLTWGALTYPVAFLVTDLTNRLRAGRWWRAPLVSTLVSSTLDTCIFFSLAFAASLSFIDPATDVSWAAEPLPILGFGPVAPLWVSLAVADWLVKLAMAAVALVPFRLVVGKLTQSAV